MGDFDIGYLNGVSWFDIHARRLSPDPSAMDGRFYDTNYLSEENGRSLRPGCLLECQGWKDENRKVHDSYVCNAGVLIGKDGEQRFTTAAHVWKAVDAKPVYHAGQPIGWVEGETIGEDIALVKSPFKFSNDFLDIATSAKELGESNRFQAGDLFWIDSACTGRQELCLHGVRAGKSHSPKDWRGPTADYDYIIFQQGVCSVKESKITKSPMIREGVCGTPLVWAGRRKRNQERESKLDEGVIGGFMLYTDVVIPNVLRPNMLYCYCQTVDDLISKGWKIAK